MARSRAPAKTDASEITRDAEEWYRERLSQPASFPWEGCRFEPVRVGPTWQVTEDGFWLLPEKTLGWKVLGWCSTWLQIAEDEPWQFTDEQARFVCHWYALDERGRFLYRDGVFQRLKGHGKDPLGAVLMAVELLGPCRFQKWDGKEPVVVDEPKAWVQTAAVSLEQTKNTMRIFPTLFSEWAEDHFGLTVLKRTVHAYGDKRVMEAVTSAPKSLEGNRATALILNETHLWDSSNEGYEMDAVIRRNRAKSPKGAARTLRITNAYDPNDDSVAQSDREAWEKADAGESLTTRLLYDSLEAPPEAPLTAEAAPEVVKAIRGDSTWLDPETMVEEILDTRNPPSQSRRFWYNQIWAHEESWTTPQQWDACKDETKSLEDGDAIVLFFDGSKSDDATGLVAVRIEDGHVFTMGCWWNKDKRQDWTVPRDEVDARVEDIHEKYDVRAFFSDPGMGEDESGLRYWDALIDKWANAYGKRYNLWATQDGQRRHAVMWDMTSPEKQRDFSQACERTLDDIESQRLTHDANPTLRDHVRNARRREAKGGWSIGKESRGSQRKIDLAVCMVGARMLLRRWEALPDRKKRSRKRSGEAAFY